MRPSKESSFGSLSISEARDEINNHIVENPTNGQKLLIEKAFLQKENKVSGEIADPAKITGAYIPAEQGKAIIELYKNANYSTLPIRPSENGGSFNFEEEVSLND